MSPRFALMYAKPRAARRSAREALRAPSPDHSSRTPPVSAPTLPLRGPPPALPREPGFAPTALPLQANGDFAQASYDGPASGRLRRVWAGWRQSLVIVTPDTVLRWQRRLFRWPELADAALASARSTSPALQVRSTSWARRSSASASARAWARRHVQWPSLARPSRPGPPLASR